MDKFGLNNKTINNINSVLIKHPAVEKAVIYGSRAKGNYSNGSDIDLVLFGDNISYLELEYMLDEFDDLMLPYSIDLSIFSKLQNDALKEHIERAGKVFYERSIPAIQYCQGI